MACWFVCLLIRSRYWLSDLFGLGFVTTFVFIVLLLAFDFWTVKNVSGRLLVGLRWWNEVREDGTNEWLFESLEVCVGVCMEGAWECSGQLR